MRLGLWLPVLAGLASIGPLLAGCGSSTPEVPISLVSPAFSGGRLSGVQSTTPEGGSFAVGGSELTCSGAYFGLNHSPSVDSTLVCSDSRTGTFTMTGTGGNDAHGTFRLSDGSQGQVVVGR